MRAVGNFHLLLKLCGITINHNRDPDKLANVIAENSVKNKWEICILQWWDLLQIFFCSSWSNGNFCITTKILKWVVLVTMGPTWNICFQENKYNFMYTTWDRWDQIKGSKCIWKWNNISILWNCYENDMYSCSRKDLFHICSILITCKGTRHQFMFLIVIFFSKSFPAQVNPKGESPQYRR